MGAGEDQARLAGSTQMAVRNISQLADVVKQGAALVGPGQSDSQVSPSYWFIFSFSPLSKSIPIHLNSSPLWKASTAPY